MLSGLKLSLGAALFAAVGLAACACGSSPQTSSATTVSSSRVIVGEAIRCTVSVRTPLQAGRALGIVFTFQNTSKHAVDVPIAYGGLWVIVKSSDGTTYDMRVP